MKDSEQITLELSETNHPLILRQYGLEGAKKLAINMALKQYKERPITAEMLYSCLSMMEIDLERMFPPPKTQEEQAEDDAEAAEEARQYQAEIAEMEPYLMNGKQLMVNENGEWGVNRYGEPIEGADYPVWKDKDGYLTARIYNEGWDWIYLENPETEEEDWEEEEDD